MLVCSNFPLSHMCMVFIVTNYLELLCAIICYKNVRFLLGESIHVLQCPNNPIKISYCSKKGNHAVISYTLI